MRFVVRKGQRTWHGMTREQVLTQAGSFETLARRMQRMGGNKEYEYRLFDRAAFYRKQAERMQP